MSRPRPKTAIISEAAQRKIEARARTMDAMEEARFGPLASFDSVDELMADLELESAGEPLC